MSELYRDFIDSKADQIITDLGGTITPAPSNAELYRDFLGRKFDDVITALNGTITPAPIGDELYRDFIERKFDDVISGIGSYIPPVSFPTVSGSIATFNTALAMPLKSCVVDFQDGTGIDSLDFTATGKNLCPPVIIGKGYDGDTGEEILRGSNASSVKFPIDKDKTYVFTKNCNVNTMIFAWDAQDNFVGRTVGANTSTRVITKESFSSGGGTKDFDSIAKIAVRFYQSSGQNIDDVIGAEYQVEVGDTTATTYEPFGDTKMFSFGKTIQSGTLNVLTGELTNNDTTPPEVINLGGMNISTLQGENNIFADTGNTTLQYIKIGGNT